ncbi:hypothetical protein HB838_14320 [Listeria seeligeri]|uniref:hypothetical protein n=1 Tax=Listeria seeligeri TaxID=1640 RepID=UPI00139CF0DC|nr:hypothetical protein [Listeria seeligeri]EDP7604066.1 hypothetical protein [Listeria monocytogenes]EEO0668533.1 hypothetical protein [Listeria monocytogenes]EEO9123639.1 hypothetical protein [Listeria monocytogenes]MBC2030620.1 hypothetical protein [Listeria seeligeri]MBC6116012.1 hypothetical protein [Listeria seeligeri]
MKLKIGKKIQIKSNTKQELENAVYQFLLENPGVEFEHKFILKATWDGRLKWILKIKVTRI